MNDKQIDLITIGRCSMDLYAQQIGAAFEDVESFETQVGGSPTNIAMGTCRLGLNAMAVTAVGAEEVGRFVRKYIGKQGVNTDFVLTKPGRTALAIIAIQPPDNFPLVFYRDDAPDHYLDLADLKKVPLDQAAMVLVAGSNFAPQRLRDACIYAVRQGARAGATTIMDLDLRVTLWEQPAAYGLNMQTVWPYCDLVIGTEEEIWAALSDEPELVWQHGGSLPADRLDELIGLIEAKRPDQQTVVLKRGAQGVSLFLTDGSTQSVAGFPVDVLNTVGAGDGFASGLLYGRHKGLAWPEAARFANACGAIVVTRHGCSAAFPTLAEVNQFIEAREKDG